MVCYSNSVIPTGPAGPRSSQPGREVHTLEARESRLYIAPCVERLLVHVEVYQSPSEPCLLFSGLPSCRSLKGRTMDG